MMTAGCLEHKKNHSLSNLKAIGKELNTPFLVRGSSILKPDCPPDLPKRFKNPRNPNNDHKQLEPNHRQFLTDIDIDQQKES
jgi:hypothetical protein